MSQTKRAKAEFSPSERRALDKIAQAPKEQRRQLLTEFVEGSGKKRNSAYAYVTRRVADNIKTNVLEESVREVKKKGNKKAPKSNTPSGEIRFELPIKRVEFENGKLIIIAERD